MQIRWMFLMAACDLGTVFGRFTGAPVVSMNLSVETRAGEPSGYSSACRCGG
jgi:hypothetical protein